MSFNTEYPIVFSCFIWFVRSKESLSKISVAPFLSLIGNEMGFSRLSLANKCLFLSDIGKDGNENKIWAFDKEEMGGLFDRHNHCLLKTTVTYFWPLHQTHVRVPLSTFYINV